MAFTHDTDNILFQLATDLVNQSSRNIFLTGKAGTGKTTFLKFIRENSAKQMAIVAPTGVAAINAGGVTIHSFFQLPISPFIPAVKGFGVANNEANTPHNLISRLRINAEKKKVFEQLELLVIDEISMVRADTMDAIDTVLRHVRQRPTERFGGVQVLLIGDMFQLPPVVKEYEWRLLAEHYNSAWFFDSRVMKEQLPVYIEFDKIYRQSEEQFIQLLNQVRNNELDEEGKKILNSRFQPNFRRTKHDGYIILTTHNDKARDINAIELQKTQGDVFTFNAEIVDDFADNAFPAEEMLQLKIGAQVMFIKNDPEKAKRYFNGKIGLITRLQADKIFVKCDDIEEEIEVKKEKWNNIRYTINKATRELEEDVLGSFSQFPLRLAWAITIHKSQGLTFEKAIIDAGEAFAAGQVYVALSRCTNLAGMVLQSRVRSSGLFTDEKIKTFSRIASSATALQEELIAARRNYSQSILLSTFDFTAPLNTSNELSQYIISHLPSFNDVTTAWVDQMISHLTVLQETASKFHSQLKWFFRQHEIPDNDKVLQERIKAGSGYFIGGIHKLQNFLSVCPVVTDSRLQAKEFNDTIKEIFAQVSMKKHLMEGFKGGFEMIAYQQHKSKFVVPSFSVNAYVGNSEQRLDSPHPGLHYQLRKLRDSICARKDTPVYMVASSRTIDEMAEFLPLTLEDMRKINGFGKVKIDLYGPQFLELIVNYCTEFGWASAMDEIESKPKPKQPSRGRPDTKAETFKLYREGQQPMAIAATRKLALATIENHLAHYVEEGDINIEELVDSVKRSLIEPVLLENKDSPLRLIKDKLGNDATFSEIKMVMAWMKFRNHVTANDQ